MRRAALFLVLLSPFVSGQSPWDGWIAVSSFKVNGLPSTTSAFPGNGGLWMLHPRATNQVPQPLLALPASMTGAGSTATRIGTNSVAWIAPCPLYPEGALLAGEIAPIATGSSVRIHLITLSGVQGANLDLPFPVGTAVGNGSSTPFGSIDQITALPDPVAVHSGQRALFALRGVNSVPVTGTGFSCPGFSTTGTPLGFFTEYAPYLIPFPLASIPAGAINALTAKRDGSTAYFAMINSPAAGQSRIYSVPIPANTFSLIATAVPPPPPPTPQLLATLPHYVLSLAVRNNGDLVAGLLAGSGTPSAQSIAIINTSTAAISYLSGPAVARNAVAVEQFTGTMFTERETYGPLAMEVIHRAADGTESVLTPGPTGGWGVVSGIAVFNNPNTVGAATTAGTTSNFGVNWDLAHPVPGTFKLPRIDTQDFSLGVVGTGPFPADGAGLIWLHTGALVPPYDLSVPPFGTVQLAVDPSVALISVPFALSSAAPRFAQVIPIPSIAALTGLRVFGQFGYVTVTGNTLWMSSRLNLTIMQ
jgi:hypothetical protein